MRVDKLSRRSSIKMVGLGALWASPLMSAVILPVHAQASSMVNLTATLNGANEVPPVTGGGTGTATAEFNPTTGEISVNISTSGLTGDIVAAHIHIGAAGNNGGVIVDLGSGISGENVVATAVVPEENIAALLAGDTYFNIHTAANPGGEVRGQLVM